MFVGKKLTNMRLLHGLSRNELASELNLTEQSIWQYENGYISPSLETINKMRIFFHVQPKFFYSKSSLANQINDQHIAYRSSVRNSRQKTKSETVHLEYLNHITDYLLAHIKYPNNTLKDIRDYAVSYINKSADKLERKIIIEHIALYAREVLGLPVDNNSDFLFALEKNGAFIYEKFLGENTDAYSTWSISDKPFIVLGNVKKSAVRRNFDLAHELGHLLLHYKIDITDLAKNDYDQLEKEANLFSANFLLPREAFLDDLAINLKKISNPNAYIDLKKKWKVSIAAMAHRAFSLHVMTYQQYRYFNASLNRNKYKQTEPLDDEIAIMKPGKIRSSFEALFEKGVISVEDVLTYTNFEMKLLSRLVNIEETFFEKYKKASHGSRLYNFVIDEKSK